MNATRLNSARLIAPVIAVATALALSLSGCAADDKGGASSDPTPSTSASNTTAMSSTPTPTASASAIVVGMTGLTVLDASGAVLEELSYSTPGIDVAGRLAKIFGVDPVITDAPGNNEMWPSRNYDWSGFTLHDEMRDPAKVVWYDYYVRVEVASVGGIQVRTTAGVHVGDPAANMVFNPSDLYRSNWNGESCGVETWFSEDGNVLDGVFLHVCSSDATGLVSRIVVPVNLQV